MFAVVAVIVRGSKRCLLALDGAQTAGEEVERVPGRLNVVDALSALSAEHERARTTLGPSMQDGSERPIERDATVLPMVFIASAASSSRVSSAREIRRSRLVSCFLFKRPPLIGSAALA